MPRLPRGWSESAEPRRKAPSPLATQSLRMKIAAMTQRKQLILVELCIALILLRYATTIGLLLFGLLFVWLRNSWWQAGMVRSTRLIYQPNLTVILAIGRTK
jgi:hypothetical protein